MSEDFKQRFVAHAKVAIERAGRAETEAATQQYLVMPFFQLLGYDPLDPDEVVPEAHASFSDKFKNRVDYAIRREGDPVIAVECKKVGTLSQANRGELKGYFNAVPSVKLGILTDGLIFQLFTDTELTNMMDDEPYAVVELREAARDEVSETVLDAILRLRKGTFDPANVGADARRKIYASAYIEAFQQTFSTPDERFVRFAMDLANVEGRRTPRLMEEHTPIVATAIQTVFDRMILQRVGFAERKDLIRVPPDMPIVEAPQPAEPEVAPESRIATTETEQRVFDYVRTRLPFLIGGDEQLFARLGDVRAVDYKTVYCVFYRQERKGRLFNFWESGAAPRLRFEFSPEIGTVFTDDLREIDEPLVTMFRRRVAELG